MYRKIVPLLLFAVTLPALARDSADHWFEVTSQHFVVLTDSNEKQARKIAIQFEQMRSVFHTLMPKASASDGSPITVLALKDRKAFQALEPAAYLAKGQMDLAGLFLQAPDKSYILLRLDAQGEHPFSVVYHEYTHFLMRSASEWIPLWLNEGLAEFYQNTDIHDKEVLLGQPSPDDILYLRQNRLIPIPVLLKVDHSSPYYHEEQKGSIFYAESWALTHYIEVTDQQKGANRLRDYAKLLIQKEDPVVAAQEVFGDLKQLQKALESYIAQGRFLMFKMNSGVQVEESALEGRVIPNADADAIRADVLVYNQRTAEAQTLIDATLRDDPKNALAHESMGYLKFREGDMQAAKKWYGEAVQLDSKSYLAHYYYAVMTMQSKSGQSNDAKEDAQIETSLRASIKLNPAFAPAYDALARYYSRSADQASQAHILNVQAIALDPANLSYRLNAASVLMNQQKLDDALAVLKTAKPIAKTPEDISLVDNRIQEIEQFKKMQASNDQEQKAFAATNASAAAGTSPVTTTDTRTYTVISSDGRKYEIKPDSGDHEKKYPTETPSGPHLTARGVLHSVKCSYPSMLTFEVAPAGKSPALSLYRNNFNDIEFSVLNFTPKSDINPCTDIEGLKAKVIYTAVSDKSVAGQVLSIELSK